MAVSRRAVFIDKDGTLLEDVPYNVDPNRIAFTPRAFAGLALLRDHGFELVLVSNQSGIARGYFDESALCAFLSSLDERLEAEGTPLLAAYFCPHHPDGTIGRLSHDCVCRKPQPGLVLQAARDHEIDLGRSFFVGDILDDVEAGNRAGCSTILLDRGSETEWRRGPYRRPDRVARDLLEAARWIVTVSPATSHEGALHAG